MGALLRPDSLFSILTILIQLLGAYATYSGISMCVIGVEDFLLLIFRRLDEYILHEVFEAVRYSYPGELGRLLYKTFRLYFRPDTFILLLFYDTFGE